MSTDQADVQNALAAFGGQYLFPFTQWLNDEPSTGTATAKARFYMAGVNLPELGSTFGEVQFQIVAAQSFIFYWTPSTPWTNVWNDWGTWLNDHNPDPSTNLDYDVTTGTPATPATQTIQLGIVPYSSDITVEEELETGEEQAPIGAIYYSSQSGNDQAPDIDLGDLSLGTNSSSNQITTLRALVNGEYVNTNGFRSGATGTYVAPGQLLCNEYFKTLDEPLIVLNGTIISTSYEPHRTIKYDDKIGGSKARYIFAGGKFNPQADSWTGSWYKLNISSATITDTITDVFDPDIDPGPGGGGPTGGDGSAGTFEKPMPPLATNTETLRTKQGYLLNDLIVGTTNEDVSAGATIDKVLVKTLKCKVYDNQKLFLVDRSLRGVTELIAYGEQSSGATQVNFDNVTPDFDYKKGSFIMLRTNELSNVITQGTATPNLYKGVTETAIYIKPDDFKTTTSTTIGVYTRDNLGSVQPTSYAARTKLFASAYVPTGYAVTAVDVYSSQNRNIGLFTARTITDATTSQGTGTANTTLTLGTPWTSILGDYLIIFYEIGASTDEIYGAKITISEI